MTIAAVRLWGRRVGAVVWDDQAGAAFEYDPEFQSSGIEVSPLRMPLSSRIYQFPELPFGAFRGLPGMLADSLPDRFGNALIDAWLVRHARDPDSFDPVERLCYVGTRAVGALEYEPETGPTGHAEEIEVSRLVELAEAVLSERATLDTSLSDEGLAQILQVGTSAGGARPKAVIAWNEQTGTVLSGQTTTDPAFEHWILKFDGVSDTTREFGTAQGYGLVEYTYAQIAGLAGIAMAPCRILSQGGRDHFMTRRFDRTDTGEKLHMQSLGAMDHADYNASGAYSYEEAVAVIRRLGLGRDAVEQQFRRAVFNVVARNQDDHVKNIAFLMNKTGEWRLSPAYDVTFSFNPSGRWTALHQMSLNGKRDDFTADDLMQFGRFCNIKPPAARAIIGEVVEAVRQWPRLARDTGVGTEAIDLIAQAHRMSVI